MIATKISPQEAAGMREDWVRAVNDLAQQVTEWAERQGWSVTRTEQTMKEEGIGELTVPVLEIDTHRETGIADEIGQVVLNPVAYNVFGGARGRVDLTAWPSYYRVMLLGQPGQAWVVRTQSGIDWPFAWSEDTFVDLVNRLTRAL